MNTPDLMGISSTSYVSACKNMELISCNRIKQKIKLPSGRETRKRCFGGETRIQ